MTFFFPFGCISLYILLFFSVKPLFHTKDEKRNVWMQTCVVEKYRDGLFVDVSITHVVGDVNVMIVCIVTLFVTYIYLYM